MIYRSLSELYGGLETASESRSDADQMLQRELSSLGRRDGLFPEHPDYDGHERILLSGSRVLYREGVSGLTSNTPKESTPKDRRQIVQERHYLKIGYIRYSDSVWNGVSFCEFADNFGNIWCTFIEEKVE